MKIALGGISNSLAEPLKLKVGAWRPSLDDPLTSMLPC